MWDDRDVKTKGDELSGVRIDFVVGGGIAAIEGPRTIRELRRFGAEVRPVFSPHASQFISALTYEWASKEKPLLELSGSAEHLSRADLVVVAPATLDLLAKSSLGLADSAASTLIQSVLGRKPVFFVPSMHESLRESPSYLEHREKLSRLKNVFFVDGKNEEGKWKNAEPIEFAQRLIHLYRRSKLLNPKRVLITVGGTRAALDDVRYLGNHSSGRTGFKIAEAFYRRGHEVEIFVGSVEEALPVFSESENFRYKRVRTIGEMSASLKETKAPDVFVHAAAVLDFEPEVISEQKLRSVEPWSLKLKPTPKLMDQISWPQTLTIGFKLESRQSAESMQRIVREWAKLHAVDYVVANSLENVRPDSYQAAIYSANSDQFEEVRSREALASALVEISERLTKI